MWRSKKLLVVAIAGTAFALLLGVGSASASTLLCKTNTAPCGAPYVVGTEFKSQLKAGTEAVLTAGFATVKCGESTRSGKVANSEGDAVKIAIETLTFAKCNCAVTVLKNGSLEIEHIAGAEAKGTATGKGTELTINCSGLSCKFGTAATGTDLGTFTGGEVSGEHAVLDESLNLPYIAGDASNFSCTLGSGTGAWKADYTVTAPKPVYVEPA